MHPGGKVRFGCFHERMFMVGQKCEGMEPPAVRLDGPLQPAQSRLPIRIIADDVAPLVASRHPMIELTSQFDA